MCMPQKHHVDIAQLSTLTDAVFSVGIQLVAQRTGTGVSSTVHHTEQAQVSTVVTITQVVSCGYKLKKWCAWDRISEFEKKLVDASTTYKLLA